MTNRIALQVVLACAVAAGCGGAGGAPPVPAGPDPGPVPRPPEGWIVADGPTDYTPESLFEYLDGGAPLYIDYGFRGLTQVRYQMGDDVFASVTLDIFDMGSELGAFGLYRNIRPPGAEPEDWGVEGFTSGTLSGAWRGSVYVQAEADDDRPELIAVMKRAVATAISDVEGSESLPKVIDALPDGGLVAGSERYVAADLYGYAFLPGGVVATYETQGGRVELFFCELGSDAEAADALARLREHVVAGGGSAVNVGDLGEGGFRFSERGLGDGLFVRSGSFIAGLRGDVAADGLVQQLVERLPRE